jgi:hypothetical protein
VVIDVYDLTLEERQQILYNHIRLGKQTKKFRRAIKPHPAFVAQHRRFISETARRLPLRATMSLKLAPGGILIGA